ncbi:MAG TPA: hypothetical protein VFV50_13145, partial [Bdellovibrionales bacterium]|nr:hypothetical protein [Bdellovibrionales bacterium]
VTGSQPFEIEVRRNASHWGNFLYCLAYLMVFPAFVFWRHHRFEYKRWAEADLSPYQWISDVGEGVGNAIIEGDD